MIHRLNLAGIGAGDEVPFFVWRNTAHASDRGTLAGPILRSGVALAKRARVVPLSRSDRTRRHFADLGGVRRVLRLVIALPSQAEARRIARAVSTGATGNIGKRQGGAPPYEQVQPLVTTNFAWMGDLL
jgi:hypothetical protein